MKKLPFLFALLACLPTICFAQKRVMNIPFEFEKSFFAKGEYDAYFLNSTVDSSFAFVLRDNKKAEYLLLDKNFKLINKVDADIKTTVFKEDINDYRGGTTNGQIYQFIYEEKENKAFSKPVTAYQLETVNFDSKNISHDKLFEIPKVEKMLCSFSDYNNFRVITADDKTSELVIYSVDINGRMKENRISFKVPETAGKKRNKLSEYLTKLEVFKRGEEPDLSAAVSSAKLFSMADRLQFVVNDGDNPVHLFTIQLPSMKTEEKFIDVKATGKDVSVNSFIDNNKLFSLILDKKSIRVAVHDLENGSLVKQHEINENFNYGLFAGYPTSEKRMGKKEDTKDVDEVKKLIKALDKGTEGIMINENEKGEYVVTVGTYNRIPAPTSGGTPAHYEPTKYTGNNDDYYKYGTGTPFTTKTDLTYVPGTPRYTLSDARYYTTTYFRLILDQTTGDIRKEKAATPVADQVKDYIEGIDPKSTAKATNQFSIGDRQFYGYYDRDGKQYVVEEIRLRR